MATLFISDVHLSSERPAKLDLFRRLIEGPAREAEALYILGDLFEVWLGDDDTTPPYPEVLTLLGGLSESGVPLYVMHGNRDVLLGEGFAEQTGCVLIPDPTEIDLYGESTLLMHGDTLCTRDLEYQAFRRIAHDPQWQRQFLDRPLGERAAIGQQLRMDSKKATGQKDSAIMDVTPEAVEEEMARYNVLRLIHGHTHRPAVHEINVAGRPARRTVLGDWYVRDSVLVCEPDDRQRLLRVEEYLEESGSGVRE